MQMDKVTHLKRQKIMLTLTIFKLSYPLKLLAKHNASKQRIYMPSQDGDIHNITLYTKYTPHTRTLQKSTTYNNGISFNTQALTWLPHNWQFIHATQKLLNIIINVQNPDV